MTATKSHVIDGDAHVLEPRDLWIRYLEPKFRRRAIRIEEDTKGWEALLVDGRSNEVVHGILGAIGGVGQDDVAALFTPGARKYEDGFAVDGTDPSKRLQVMDGEGIDAALLYPTLGLLWEPMLRDSEIATAYSRAYNRYIVDYCKTDNSRLYPVAHVNLLDPDLGLEELKRARKDGCVGVFISPFPGARGARRLDDPSLARFFDTASDLDMPLSFHVIVPQAEDRMLRDFEHGGTPENNDTFTFTFLGIEVMAAFTQMLTAGVLERHPKLRVAVLETGCNWLGAWLDRMDHKWEATSKGRNFACKIKPSEYFQRQCVISCDPDETMTDSMVARFGPEKIIWASDYPHIDAQMNVVGELKHRLSGLPEASLRLVLGDNLVKFYGLN